MRNKRKALNVLCLLAAVMLSSSGMLAAKDSVDAGARPNVLLIMADDLGFYDLSCYGHPVIRTPVLDRLAAQGIRLTDFHSGASVCTPSRMSLLTGAYPTRVGWTRGVVGYLMGMHDGLSPEALTIAEIFQSEGYATAIAGKWHVGDQPENRPHRKGFDSAYYLTASNNQTREIWRGDEIVENPFDNRLLTQRFTDEAIRFIRANQQRQFFLYLPYTAPHFPVQPHPQWKGHSAFGDYGDVVEELDARIGEILATLRELKLDRRTIVIFCSDNGPNPGQKSNCLPFRGEKWSALEGGTRVPCIVAWPGGIPAGQVSGALFSAMDLLPSLCRVCGIDWQAKSCGKPKIDGLDLWDALLGKPGAPVRHELLYWAGKDPEPEAVRADEWKLFFDRRHALEGLGTARMTAEQAARLAPYQKALKPDAVNPPILFNLREDPGETVDLSGKSPDKVPVLQSCAQARMAEIKASGILPLWQPAEPSSPGAKPSAGNSKEVNRAKPASTLRPATNSAATPREMPARQMLAEPAQTGGAAAAQRVIVSGEVGEAMAKCAARFRSAPFNSLPWLRADLTGETVSPYDNAFGNPMRRPYKEYSGDISGRFIEIMCLESQGDLGIHPALAGLLAAVLAQQRPGGYFCASGVIDWQKPFDFAEEGGPAVKRMMPALWGNSRMLCGLVEAMRAFPAEAAIAHAARELGNFYLSVLPRFTDPNRVEEYTRTGSYAAGYVTCWFPAMEGLVRLANLTGEWKYLNAAKTLAAFYQRFDQIPIDHSHGMLCCQVALLELYEATEDASYLKRVEQRWDELVRGGYINPAGGILEKCQVSYHRRLVDEGCAIADWLRLNLALGRVTGRDRYWAMAERTLHNHLLQNQTLQGGFGHRQVLCDQEGAWGLGRGEQESTWCCTYHGELGFINLRQHLLRRTDSALSVAFALDFRSTDAAGTTVSTLRSGLRPAEVLRQHLSLAGQPATVVRLRRPHWADALSAVGPDGNGLETEVKDGWCATKQPVTEVEFVYTGSVYAEDRHCTRLPDGPGAGTSFVLGYGPKLLATEGRTAPVPAWPTTLEALKAGGLEPFPASLRGKDCCFVFGREL